LKSSVATAKPDFLDRIVAARRDDLRRLGPDFGAAYRGFPIPAKRKRPVVPFLAEPGVILEIKRASPSKGDIAPFLDAAATARAYASAGARNVSVLTEGRWFKGGLEDLMDASAAEPSLSYLRKDFILEEEELEIAYRAGADAVLLIARMHDELTLRTLAATCRDFGMTPFVEVREEEDYRKLAVLASGGPVLSGVNARDLRTFSIDPLIPAAARSRLTEQAVYESGIDGPGAARYARDLGFQGILVGEAAAKDQEVAAAIASAFVAPRSATTSGRGSFWRALAGRRAARPDRPLVKICGLARVEDALLAAELGADLLGFVFAESPRAASAELVRAVAARLEGSGLVGEHRPLLVGVVVDPDSEAGRTALDLARSGVLDAIQYHGEGGIQGLGALDRSLDGAGRYAVVRLGSKEDLNGVRSFRAAGEPRVLLDAKSKTAAGGTGLSIPDELVRPVAEGGGLWLAGGLGPETVGGALERFRPELVDASSRLESSPGKKDRDLLERYFKEIHRHANS